MSDRSETITRLAIALSDEGRRIVAQFEDEWGRNQRPSIDACLSGTSTGRRSILEQLVHIDLGCRVKAGEPARVEEYLQRYPELAADESTVLALLWTEYEARRSCASKVNDAEYVKRFPQYGERLPWHDAQPSRAPEHGAWNVGDVILDVYEVKRLDSERAYAKGGMGVVYRVHHRGWDLDLAVKSPKPGMLADEEAKRNFERECEAWIRLGLHPNVVSCYYVRRVDGIPRVFAEFVEGGSLDDWIQDQRLYDGGPEEALRRILDIAVQVAWGLHYAHEQGLIHQDVKPANVMLQGDVAKVSDFGLARFQAGKRPVSTDTTQGTMVVTGGGMTPAYCSPEQLEVTIQAEAGLAHHLRTKLTRRTDIWSWAVSVLAMFCGESPCHHGGHTARAVLDAYLKRGPDDERFPTMPKALIGLLRQCFRRNADARPRTMREVAADLVEIYQHVTGAAYPRQEPETADLQAESMSNRAVSLLDLGKHEEAAQLLEEAWQRHPWQPQVTHNRALLAWRSGRMTDTDLVAQLKELGATRPRDWEAAYSLGAVQLERGDVERAVESLERSAQLGGDCEVRAALEQARALLPQTARCVRAFTGQTAHSTPVWLSADERWGLSSADAKTLRLWNVATGRTMAKFLIAAGGADSLSADGRWKLSVLEDRTLRLWNLAEGRQVQAFREIAWGAPPPWRSPDGRWTLAEGEGHALELRETAGGNLVRAFRGHAGPVNCAVLSADGRWVLSGSSDHTLRLWEVATGCCLRTLQGHTDPVNRVFLGSDGRWALSASHGKALRLWNVELLCGATRRFAAPLLLCHVTSSEEAGRSQAKFHRLCAGARAAIADGRLGEALDLLRSARALRGYEVARESLDLWNLAGKRCVRAAARDAWCAQTLEGHAGEVCSVVLNADASLALSGSEDKTLRLWQTDGGRCLRTFEGHADWVRAVALSAGGRWALSGSWDKTVRLWEVATGRCVRVFQGHTKYVTSVALSADGRRALSASWDRTLRLWEVLSGRCLRTFSGHTEYVHSVFADATGRHVLSGGEDKTLRLWDAADGRVLRVFEGHNDWVHAVALSADGRWALSGSKDWTIRLWDVATGRCARVFKGHSGAVTCVGLSSDGRWVLSGSRDKTVRLWEAASGACVRTLAGHTAPVSSVFLSADSRWAISGGEDGTMRLWELDWDYQFPGWADWDAGARPYLETFLALHTPLAEDGVAASGPPAWTEARFQELLGELQQRGFGWLRAEGVRRELEKMVAQS